jgi:hypothetical protein
VRWPEMEPVVGFEPTAFTNPFVAFASVRE